MDELVLGDRVRVSSSQFSPVYLFTHRDASASSKMVVLSTAANQTLRLSPSHYLYINDALMPAGTAQPGDTLISASASPTIVVAVSFEETIGLFNPHTVHGDIVVDGIVTSTYTTALHPALAHAILWPLRVLSEFE